MSNTIYTMGIDVGGSYVKGVIMMMLWLIRSICYWSALNWIMKMI